MSGKIIIPIKGGLGNQLFQYARGLKLATIDKKNVIFDTSFFSEKNSDVSRPFLLGKFNITLSENFKDIKKSPVEKFIRKAYLKITGNYSYYQSEKYFIEAKDQILKQFTLKNPLSVQAEEFAKNIGINSVSIHIRRGDYVNNSHHGLCDLGYYYKALHHIKSKIDAPHFFIFSDDIEWAKNNLQMHEATFVSNNDLSEVEEMTLMSMCSHNIIANSTFSWWAAYLNKNPGKIVIAPKQWTKKHTSDKLDILPSSWIQL